MKERTNKKTGRRLIIVTALMLLIMGVSATGIIAFAARWFDQTNKTNNTVTVDHPVVVTVTGTASSGTIMPGVATSKVTTTFAVTIDYGDATATLPYKLVIKDIDFDFDPILEGSTKDTGYFDDEAELTAIFGNNNDVSGVKDATAFAAFLREFKVDYNGTDKGSLIEGVVINPTAANATNQKISITATDDLLLIARGGTLKFTIALEV